MIQNVKAWDKEIHRMGEVVSINFEDKIVVYRDWEYGISEEIPFVDVEFLQSTGLLDKNGTEIFEGDILKWHGTMGHGWFEDVQDEVVYDEQELIFKFKNRNEDIKNIANMSVIIGNKFEHPNLLKED